MLKTKGNSKKAQTWSLDLIIGVVVFLLLIVILYSLLAGRQQEELQLRQQADLVYARLEAGRSLAGASLPKAIEGNSIDPQEIYELYQLPYEQLKSELGVTADVCIVIVDETINGEEAIVPISDPGGTDSEVRLSAGTQEDQVIITKNGIFCGS